MTVQQSSAVPKQAGLLPIRPTQAQARTSSPVDVSKSTKAKTAAQDGVKIKIRRLPPGITEQEFVAILGDTWKAGKGKVGWFEYHAGHIPKSASKEPTPAFAMLQVREEDIDELSQVVQNAIWEDAKGTFNSPSLVGPPCIERSLYKKIPLGKPKKDPKEGTIDQDEDYMAFLASLAEDPTMKQNLEELNVEDSTEPESDVKTTTTPLVQAILDNREKRANKAKEAASSKSSKHARQESQGIKGKSSASTPEESKKKSKEKGAERPKETVRILRKQTATEAAAEAAKVVAKDIKSGASASDVANSRRTGIQGVANILKRDLGLSSGSAARKARQEMAKQEGSKKAEGDTKTKDSRGKEIASSAAAASSTPAQERPSTPTAPKAQADKSSRSGRSRRGKELKAAETKAGGNSDAPATAPKAPVILQKKKEDSTASSSNKDQTPAPKAASKAATSSAAPAAPAPPTGPRAGAAKGNQAQKKSNAPMPNSGATRAFLKHANPSQGVTEALLKEAMQVFGGVSFVEIDRRKGFAYVDFADQEGLSKAMAASPVSVAQATVQVLERKDQSKKTATTPNASNPTGAASSTSAAAAPPNPPAAPPSNADKSGNTTSGEQQQPKRSRRRGRGRGGNGGGSGNAESKSADQGSSGGAGSSTPAAGASSNG
ncbi:hypothetical protein VPNG_01286 [Cytospora leucostoma]|uniref:RRM domain-containing protein n=1 Tax=Cytospora leucostoma TaxID=1230097 RepID=A0A423XLM9_9PEZI|nr:hypothetical protein VPNG_01286 [Cytospora leucostoma]